MINKVTFILILILFLGGKKNDGYTSKGVSSKVITELKYNVFTIKKGEMDLKVSETRPTSSDFYINSNFFTSKNPIGLVVVNGKRKNSRVKGGGLVILLLEVVLLSLNCSAYPLRYSEYSLFG